MRLDEAMALMAREYQQGLFDNVRALAAAVLTAIPGHPQARLYADLATRPSPPTPRADRFTLVWRCDRVTHDWSRDWLLRLLAALPLDEAPFGLLPEVAPDRTIMVANKLNAEDAAWCRSVFVTGHRLGLIHLGDEGHTDDRRAHDHCDFVIRAYWSPLLAHDRRVLTIPLGPKGGVTGPRAERPASQRPFSWSFAGDPNKTSRPAMLRALAPITPHHSHLTNGFFDPQGLDTQAYQATLEDAVFAPCPTGFISLDSFRVSEALECGCVPIVERRPGFDYFRHALGPHPMITVDDWAEAPALMRALLADPVALETRRRACLSWWRALVTRTRDAAARLAWTATATEPMWSPIATTGEPERAGEG